MFPEYRELITELKNYDNDFLELFQRHGALDQKIRNMECHAEPGTHEEIESLKKQKLLIKDRVFARLKKADAARASHA
jgi:uncharacterized protein YdcH (DUF465 family)